MATLAEIETAIRNADAAGRRDDVRALAAERDKMMVRGGDEASRASRVAAGTQKILGGMDDQTPPEGEFQARPMDWRKNLVNVFDAGNLMATGATGGLLDKAVAGARAPFTDLSYDEELAKQRDLTGQARARQGPIGSAMAEGTGVMMLPTARGLGPNILARGGISAAEGASYGAAQAYGNDQDVTQGAGEGALWGLGGSVVGEGVDQAAKLAGRVKSAFSAPDLRKQLLKTAKDAAIGAGWGTVAYGDPLLAGLANAFRGGAYKVAKPIAQGIVNAPPQAGAPATRDLLSKIISRSGIWGSHQGQ